MTSTTPSGNSLNLGSGAARPRSRTVAALAAGCLLLLAACGDDHPASSASGSSGTSGGSGSSGTGDVTSALSMLQAQVTSGQLPTLDLSTSTTGTDANGNGVRDDIDALITAQTDMTVQKAALTQVAQSIQATLSLDTTNAAAVTATATAMRKAIACLFTQYDGPTASGRFHWVQELSINTMARLQAYDQFNIAMNNTVGHMATGAVCNA